MQATEPVETDALSAETAQCEVQARVPLPDSSLHWSSQATGSTVGHLAAGEGRYDIVQQPEDAEAQGEWAHCGALNARHEPVSELLDKDCGGGRSCLRFEGYAHPAAGCPSDRLELVLSHGEQQGALLFNQTRHLRFALKVTPETIDPAQRVLINQVWQHQHLQGGPMHGLGPPFFIAVARHPDPQLVNLEFAYRSDRSPDAVTFLKEALVLDTWAVFHIRLRPSFEGEEGSILVWRQSGASALDFTESTALNYDAASPASHRFHWGFAPDPERHVGAAFSIRIGMYRPAPMRHFGVRFDHVQLGVVANEQPNWEPSCWRLDPAIFIAE